MRRIEWCNPELLTRPGRKVIVKCILGQASAHIQATASEYDILINDTLSNIQTTRHSTF